MILVRTQLLQTLQDEGLDRIPVVGLPFDPAVSESVATAPVKEPEQHHMVVKELLRGYRLNGRIARALARRDRGLRRGAARRASAPRRGTTESAPAAAAPGGPEPVPIRRAVARSPSPPRPRRPAAPHGRTGSPADRPAETPADRPPRGGRVARRAATAPRRPTARP